MIQRASLATKIAMATRVNTVHQYNLFWGNINVMSKDTSDASAPLPLPRILPNADLADGGVRVRRVVLRHEADHETTDDTASDAHERIQSACLNPSAVHCRNREADKQRQQCFNDNVTCVSRGSRTARSFIRNEGSSDTHIDEYALLASI